MNFKQWTWWQKVFFAAICVWGVTITTFLVICSVKILHEHDWKREAMQSASCMAVGYERYTCDCGEEKVTLFQALGHDNRTFGRKQPTCEGNGWKAYVTCVRCEYSTYEEVPALGHQWEEGETENFCKRCQIAKEEVEGGHTHFYHLEIIREEPTCEENGVAEYCCECGECVEVSVSPLGHTGSTAICGEAGKCTRCGIFYKISLTHTYRNDRCIYCNLQKPYTGETDFGQENSSQESTSSDSQSSNSSSNEEEMPTEEGELRFENTGNGYTCMGFEEGKESPFVVIPDFYKGVPVTKVAANAFQRNRKIVRLTIGKNVTTIGENAFQDCYNLVEIYNLSSCVLQSSAIGGTIEKTFHTSLHSASSVTLLSDGCITYTRGEMVTLVGYDTNKKAITLPQGVTKLYRYVFEDGLEELTVCSTVTEIAARAFEKVKTLKKVYFEDTSGWKVKTFGEQLSGLDNAEVAAAYLTGADNSKYWEKGFEK